MSRAFVKEIDDAPAPRVERAVSAAPNLVTPRGARVIGEEIAAIESQLAEGTNEAEEERLRRDLRYWQSRRATAQLVPRDPRPRTVAIGTRVTIRRGILMQDVWIVGEDEADPAKGRIAWTAPLARALDGAERGDVVELQAGGRFEEIRVFAVAAGAD